MATQEEVLQHLQAINPQASPEELQQHVQNIASGADPVMAQRVAMNMFSDAKRKELMDQAAGARDSTQGKISDALAALSTWGTGHSSVEAGRANREARYAHAKEGLSEFDKARERALNEGKATTEALKSKRAMSAEDLAAGRANTTFGQSQEDRLTKNANEAQKTAQEKTLFEQQQEEFGKKRADEAKQRDPNSQESEMMRQAMAAMPGVDASKLAGKSAYDLNLVRGVMTDAQKMKFDQERVKAAEKLSQIHEQESVAERSYQHKKDEETRAAAATQKAVLDKTEEEQIRAIDNEQARLNAIKDSAKGVYTGWGAETGNMVRDKFGLENEGFKALNAQIKAVPESNRSIRGYTPMEIPLNNGPEALNKSVDTSLKILQDRRNNILGLAKKTGKNVTAFEQAPEQQQTPVGNKPAWAK